jgi:hypothetical protein
MLAIASADTSGAARSARRACLMFVMYAPLHHENDVDLTTTWRMIQFQIVKRTRGSRPLLPPDSMNA